MKYSVNFMLMEKIFLSTTKDKIGDKGVIKNIMQEYKNIVERASDIENNNRCWLLCYGYIFHSNESL